MFWLWALKHCPVSSFNYDNFLLGDFTGAHSSSDNYIYYRWKEDVETFYKSVFSAVVIVMLLAKVKRIIKALKESRKITKWTLLTGFPGGPLSPGLPALPFKTEIIIWMIKMQFNQPNWFQFILRKTYFYNDTNIYKHNGCVIQHDIWVQIHNSFTDFDVMWAYSHRLKNWAQKYFV